MNNLLTIDQQLKFESSLAKQNKIFEKKQEKLKIWTDKEITKLDKQFENYKQKYMYKIAKFIEHRDDVLFSIQTKINERKFCNLDTLVLDEKYKKLFHFFESKLQYFGESFDIARQNFELAKQDITDAQLNQTKYDQKVTVQSVESKYSKINFRNALSQVPEEDKKSKTKLEIKKEIFENSNQIWKPTEIRFDEWIKSKKTNFQLSWLRFTTQFRECREWSIKDWLTIKIWTVPLYLYVIFAGIVATAILTDTVQQNMIYPLAIMLVVSILGGTIFNKIPIWNKFLGGGVMGSMFVGAILVYVGAIPTDSAVYKTIKTWFGTQDFLSLYISVLLVGAVISIPRKMIIKSIGGFFIIIIIGSVFSVALGYVSGLITGTSTKNLILNYALPILCDGNGGGIQPIAKIAEQNGYNGGNWMSSALAISTIASILSVIAAGILNGIGKAKPSMSGDGRLVKKDIHTVERKAVAKDRNVAVGFTLIVCIYVLATIIQKQILTKEVIGVEVPNFAWMIIICLIISITNFVTPEVKAGLLKVNQFISKQTTWLMMLGVGIVDIDLKRFIESLNPTSLFISLMFVGGGILGTMLFAKLFQFNQIETTVSAGLCMTAQGGSGAIACLGAANRMELMPYSQITCRIAGSIVLVFASLAFAAWPNK